MYKEFRHIISELKKLLRSDCYISFNDISTLCVPRFIERLSWPKRLYVKHLLSCRVHHNRRFIKRVSRQGMRCAGCELDMQQIEAIVACEDAQLVLASAGSGKTLSLLGKIEYLHNKLKIPPEQILAISFTQKTVVELKERCSVKGVEIRTFHSLGNNILRFSEHSSLGARHLISEGKIAIFIKEYCEFLIRNDKGFARNFVDYILFFFSAPSSPGEIKSHASRVNFNRLYLRFSLLSAPNENIRAKDEQLIANWLYIHDLKYEHDKEYHFLKTKYKVTFTLNLPQKIYIDYLVIDQKGHSIYGTNYLRDARWKKDLHATNCTNYIAIQSWRWNDWSIFTFLKNELIKHRVVPRRRNDSNIFDELLRNSSHRKEIESFYSMLKTFLLLHKNGLYSAEDIKKRLANDNTYTAKRNALFLKIYRRIYQAYEQFLYKTRRYDFADMINSAEKCVREIPECARGYKYILLDEVQDLSRNRLMLVRSIIQKNPGCKLFAVGDDWQSIYRFTGSDLGLIREFESTFGLMTRRSFIESTHRFGQPTIRISCDFVQRNPSQSHKLVHNIQKSKTPIFIILNKPTKSSEGQDTESLRIILRTIINMQGLEAVRNKTIQVISRYNHDIRRIKSDDFIITAKDNTGEVFEIYWQDLKMEFCSMHKSKGITRDIVIVLNMNSDLMGMPATRESDPIIDALLAKDDSFPFAEERRLFYVAITRAREATYLIANRKNPSPFLFEISDNIKQAYGTLCPKCHTGELIKKRGRFGEFFYCSNYAYGCNYLKRI